MAWRLIVEAKTVEEWNDTVNFVLDELQIIKEHIKTIRRYPTLDYKSNHYFSFLESTVDQLRLLLETPRIADYKKKKEGG